MSANTEAKKVVVSEIKEKMERAQAMVLLDYRGLTVQEVNDLRKACRNAGVEYRVLKNTLVQRAADDLGVEASVAEYLQGPTAVAFGYDDPTVPAKVLSDFIKRVRKTQIKGGILGTQVMTPKAVAALSDLPSKEVMVARLLGTLNAPISGLVNALSGVPRGLVTALSAVAKQKESA